MTIRTRVLCYAVALAAALSCGCRSRQASSEESGAQSSSNPSAASRQEPQPAAPQAGGTAEQQQPGATSSGAGVASEAARPGARGKGAERASAPAASRPSPYRGAPSEAARAAAPAAEREARPAFRTVVLEPGTTLRVRTTSTLSTKTNAAGDVFEASLAEPVVVDGRQVLPRGAAVKGRVVEADPGGRVKGLATLSLALTSVTAGGEVVPVSTGAVAQQAKSSTKKDAAKVGIGAGIGAAIGAIAGGGKGAAIGAAAGGGAGTGAVLATRGDAAVVPAETVLTFTLSKPATLRVKE